MCTAATTGVAGQQLSRNHNKLVENQVCNGMWWHVMACASGHELCNHFSVDTPLATRYQLFKKPPSIHAAMLPLSPRSYLPNRLQPAAAHAPSPGCTLPASTIVHRYE
jgi:hypothetical protein